MGTAPFPSASLLISGAQAEASVTDGRATRSDPEQLTEGQVLLRPLLVATVLSVPLWWGIIAGIRWVWSGI